MGEQNQEESVTIRPEGEQDEDEIPELCDSECDSVCDQEGFNEQKGPGDFWYKSRAAQEGMYRHPEDNETDNESDNEDAVNKNHWMDIRGLALKRGKLDDAVDHGLMHGMTAEKKKRAKRVW